jgi:hypothetical protein
VKSDGTFDNVALLAEVVRTFTDTVLDLFDDNERTREHIKEAKAAADAVGDRLERTLQGIPEDLDKYTAADIRTDLREVYEETMLVSRLLDGVVGGATMDRASSAKQNPDALAEIVRQVAKQFGTNPDPEDDPGAV